ncbi:hypothetical protein CHS0354_041493 [Potamilus streckersoni]|uniref:Uncharacterized protein n=1 Tax=Potamilus streckersoni TaxID=2493646 RepID=A0AAE0TA12_9BIVA|nr:hypothetical protein CHS0354_041493 [Potamilus streckersoni]
MTTPKDYMDWSRCMELQEPNHSISETEEFSDLSVQNPDHEDLYMDKSDSSYYCMSDIQDEYSISKYIVDEVATSTPERISKDKDNTPGAHFSLTPSVNALPKANV